MIKKTLLIISFASLIHTEVRQKHPDVGLNVKQLIKKYGYPFQSHTVVTEDGYILEMHRIPHGKNNIRSDTQPVVLLMPGVLCSSGDWVNMGPEKSLGLVLADKGYDVWLGNYRGTTWSKRHITLDPEKDKKQYWNFSFDEIGYYDLPAHIDHILEVTKQEKLFYIGYSIGTTTFFTMTSTRPEYNNKIRLMSALAPVMYNENIRNIFFVLLAKVLKPFEILVERYELYEFLPYNPLIAIIAQTFCNDDSPFQDLCAKLFYIVGGYNPSRLNKTMIPVIASNSPAGSGIKVFIHTTQEILASKSSYFQKAVTEKFQKYDFGKVRNLIKYGQPTPPEYDISKITTPLAFYYSDNDYLSSNIVVERAVSALPNVIELNRIEGFSHLDFLWAIDVVPLLYNRLIEVMEEY